MLRFACLPADAHLVCRTHHLVPEIHRYLESHRYSWFIRILVRHVQLQLFHDSGYVTIEYDACTILQEISYSVFNILTCTAQWTWQLQCFSVGVKLWAHTCTCALTWVKSEVETTRNGTCMCLQLSIGIAKPEVADDSEDQHRLLKDLIASQRVNS